MTDTDLYYLIAILCAARSAYLVGVVAGMRQTRRFLSGDGSA